MPKVIYQVESKLNGLIKVYDIGTTRKIIVNNIVQSINPDSPSCQKLVWGQLVNSLKNRLPVAEKILILGMAGGTMAHLISRNYPDIKITSVEYDEVMIDIAKKFFNIDSIPNHKILNENALKVVVEPEEYDMSLGSFDVLIVDIFNGEKYPDLGKTGNFISAVKRLVREDGLLVFNRIYTKDFQDEVNSFMNNLNDFIPNFESEIVAGYTNSDNIIIFGKV
ncbi:hypothetical protein K0B04_03500 [Patescibacteria group bacterium]|nr:hypothetical protein [Patescibacteria group bacterium]